MIDQNPLLTNMAIAKAIGANPATVSRWKGLDVAGINATAFDRLARFLKLEPEQLYEQIGAPDGAADDGVSISGEAATRLAAFAKQEGLTVEQSVIALLDRDAKRRRAS